MKEKNRIEEINRLLSEVDDIVHRHSYYGVSFPYTYDAFSLLSLLVSERYEIALHNNNEDDIAYVDKYRESVENLRNDLAPVENVGFNVECISQQYRKDRQIFSIDITAPIEAVLYNFERQVRHVISEWHFVPEYRLFYDIRRSIQGKMCRSPHGTFSRWLLCLRVYDALKNRGATVSDIIEAPWFDQRPGPGQERVYVAKAERAAKALIEAAWSGVPLASVKLPA